MLAWELFCVCSVHVWNAQFSWFEPWTGIPQADMLYNCAHTIPTWINQHRRFFHHLLIVHESHTMFVSNRCAQMSSLFDGHDEVRCPSILQHDLTTDAQVLNVTLCRDGIQSPTPLTRLAALLLVDLSLCLLVDLWRFVVILLCIRWSCALSCIHNPLDIARARAYIRALTWDDRLSEDACARGGHSGVHESVPAADKVLDPVGNHTGYTFWIFTYVVC